ncbi:MAG TPA: glycosyltransferase [Phnomibacter sp.]|nr:glycosyltransferase [Phnomibacter sp.]
MYIAIHTGIVAQSPADSHWQLISEAIIQLAASQPAHRFLVIGTQKPGENGSGGNLQFKALNPPPSLGPIGGWWYRKQVTKALARQKCDLLLNFDAAWKGKLSIPHVMVLHPDWQSLSKELLGEKKLSGTKLALLQQLQGLCVGFAGQAEKMAAATGIPMEKIQVAGPASLPIFRPMVWVEKEAVKTSFSGGQEYFLYFGPAAPTGDMVVLLKAFSQFKKRQKCNMQLLIALSKPDGHAALHHKLASYKYRSDVRVMQEQTMTEIARLATASYAVISPLKYQPGWWLLGSMQVGTAIAVVNTTIVQEVCGDACINLTAWETDALAQNMMLLYKDENYRGQLVANAAKNIENKNMNVAVAALVRSIESAISHQQTPA